MALSALWIAGRAALLMVVAAVELSFLPALAVMLAPPLLRACNLNTPMLGVIVLLWLIDGAFVG